MSEIDLSKLRQSSDVSAQRLARVYAEALLGAAEKHGQGDEVFEELTSLVQDVFPADPQFEAFLSSGAVGRLPKGAVLRSVFENRAGELFFNFLMVLNEHDRLELVRTILGALQTLRDERAKRVRVQVVTAAPLADDQRGQLKDYLQGNLQKEPMLETTVDPALIGGMIVRVGDWVYDASVRTKLESLRSQIITRSSHEIQSGRDRFSSANGN
jgi:F-type H+-transporting ATPase subunit delta